jgi:uncharacterized protein (TIGR02145 family)
MAENLNYNESGSKCGTANGTLKDEDNAICETYGRLYDWATAMALPSSCNSSLCSEFITEKHKGICPSGWHLPDYDDIHNLEDAVGGISTAGKYLKAASGWDSDYNGADDYGFSALPGGSGDSGVYTGEGRSGYWWISFENIETWTNSFAIRIPDLNPSHPLARKSYLFSVRCLQD